MRDIPLTVRGLTAEFPTKRGTARAVDDVSFEVRGGETLAVVGESGSGKSTLGNCILRLLRPPGRVRSGEVYFQGKDLLKLSPRQFRRVLGKDIGAVFQDPQTSLDPVHTIGSQVAEAVRAHSRKTAKADVRRRCVEAMARAGVPDPEDLWRRYPFELSGGMRQRVMIAIATVNRPTLLIADEPTTALDVTTQLQVIDAFRAAQQEIGAATILVTHNLGLVAEYADTVAVMYAGRIIEYGDAKKVFRSPEHPYTVGLLRCQPRADARAEVLPAIAGSPPDLTTLGPGCAFQPRCERCAGHDGCTERRPSLLTVEPERRLVACHLVTDERHRRASAGAGSER